MASSALGDVVNMLEGSPLGLETPIDDFRNAYRMLGGMLPQDTTVRVEPGEILARLRDEGTALPVTAVLLSPWCDLTMSGESMRTLAHTDPMVKPEALARWTSLYCSDVPPNTPYASPLFADLAGLPPLLVHVGDREVLLDDSRRLAGRARAAGVEVELYVAEGMIHVWQFFAGQVPEADEAVAAIGRWIRARA